MRDRKFNKYLNERNMKEATNLGFHQIFIDVLTLSRKHIL
jgi:hypothetical protein